MIIRLGSNESVGGDIHIYKFYRLCESYKAASEGICAVRASMTLPYGPAPCIHKCGRRNNFTSDVRAAVNVKKSGKSGAVSPSIGAART